MVWDCENALLFVATLVAGLGERDFFFLPDFVEFDSSLRIALWSPVVNPVRTSLPTLEGEKKRAQQGWDRGLCSGDSPDVSVESVRVESLYGPPPI